MHIHLVYTGSPWKALIQFLCNIQVLEEQLFDERLYNFWRDQSIMYQIHTSEQLELEARRGDPISGK